jgi:hypothetical protein
MNQESKISNGGWTAGQVNDSDITILKWVINILQILLVLSLIAWVPFELLNLSMGVGGIGDQVFYIFLGYPVVALISLIYATVLYYKQKYRASIFIILIPFIPIVLFILLVIDSMLS